MLDGGLGTLLQAAGLKPGELTESWNITQMHGIHNTVDIMSIHNAQKYGFSGESLESRAALYYYVIRAGKALSFSLPPGARAEV